MKRRWLTNPTFTGTQTWEDTQTAYAAELTALAVRLQHCDCTADELTELAERKDRIKARSEPIPWGRLRKQ
jgi:hypothetical protein